MEFLRMLSDIEIAQKNKNEPITEFAAKLGMTEDDLARFRDRMKINHIVEAPGDGSVQPYTQDIHHLRLPQPVSSRP